MVRTLGERPQWVGSGREDPLLAIQRPTAAFQKQSFIHFGPPPVPGVRGRRLNGLDRVDSNPEAFGGAVSKPALNPMILDRRRQVGSDVNQKPRPQAARSFAKKRENHAHRNGEEKLGQGEPAWCRVQGEVMQTESDRGNQNRRRCR